MNQHPANAFITTGMTCAISCSIHRAFSSATPTKAVVWASFAGVVQSHSLYQQRGVRDAGEDGQVDLWQAGWHQS